MIMATAQRHMEPRRDNQPPASDAKKDERDERGGTEVSPAQLTQVAQDLVSR